MKPYYEEPDIKIYQGHILEVLKSLDDESVNTIITSPPYWSLRDYGEDTKIIWDGDKNCEHNWDSRQFKQHSGRGDCQKSAKYSEQEPIPDKQLKDAFCSKCNAWYGQLGLEPTLDLYLSHLWQITDELYRVLKKIGILFWNHGDSYGGAPASGVHSDYIGQKGSIKRQPKPGIAAKSLALQNYRLILGMVDIEYRILVEWRVLGRPQGKLEDMLKHPKIQGILRNSIIWNKPNHMPSSVKDRFANGYEPVFMLTKNSNPIYYYNIKTGLMADRKAKDPKENIDWEWRDCPNCKGTGKIEKEKETKIEEEMAEEMGSPRARYHRDKIGECKRCKGTGKIKYSFWRALDYWFDLDAVRVTWTDERKSDIERAIAKHPGYNGKYGNGYNIGQRDLLPGQGIKGQPVGDPTKGKNPGDVWDIREEQKVAVEKEGKIGSAQRVESFFDKYGGKTHPLGKNPSDCWSIPTQPFPEAHFATFPEDLVKPMILAGCPQWICKKCGKARVRIVNRIVEDPQGGEVDQKRLKGGVLKSGAKPTTSRPLTSIYKESLSTTRETIGWTDCNCNAGWTPGIVLDPFVGAGAVLRVAKNLGYAAIGIDIKKEYCNMAIKGIKNITPSLPLTD